MRKPTVEDEFERSKAELEEIVRKYKNHDYRCLVVYSDDGWLEACFNENDDIGEYSIALTKNPMFWDCWTLTINIGEPNERKIEFGNKSNDPCACGGLYLLD